MVKAARRQQDAKRKDDEPQAMFAQRVNAGEAQEKPRRRDDQRSLPCGVEGIGEQKL
jgi:hypothetical protein